MCLFFKHIFNSVFVCFFYIFLYNSLWCKNQGRAFTLVWNIAKMIVPKGTIIMELNPCVKMYLCKLFAFRGLMERRKCGLLNQQIWVWISTQPLTTIWLIEHKSLSFSEPVSLSEQWLPSQITIRNRKNIYVLLSFLKYSLTRSFIYLFLAALGVCCCVQAFSSCGEQGQRSVVVHRLCGGSLVEDRL